MQTFTFASNKQNLMSSSTITHQGIIDSITNNLIKVKIVNMSACSACHAKGACSASDMEEKIIDVTPNGESYKIGEPVTIYSKLTTGFKALFYGYIFPLLVVLFMLILLTSLSVKETTAGLFSIGILAPYYFGLYLFRNKIKKSFIFEILK